MSRPSTPLLSPEIIGEAALALSAAGEPFGVNAIARRLGVRPSSLYNHVDGMDGIVELMRGRLVEDYRVEPQGESWDEYLLALLREQRRMYADHPQLVPLLVGKTITHPAVIAAYDDLATVLVEGGFPEGDVLAVIGILDAFAIGFGLDLASPEEVWQPGEETRTLGRILENGERGDARSDRTFELGARLLVDSLRTRFRS
ncbi:TetR/AcrR family transcriptional regulator [Microbacterium hydrocarbonoxydans]|uniref:TetR/AcrR family transcriptional regulator n=1 Tax=Microbacterium hydrocarbonoxydans TaxID=273678 RepID=UPI0007BB3686|nr:TetR/AcrR family transcriptional regulator C-terminal domain-containing protein [Microbacterium hydrocarbonoxydans]GAT73549.1 putative TetR family transcriptional regulator [Microbacterium sp. HM58-2]